MTHHNHIFIILNVITFHLCQAMAYHENLPFDLCKLKQKLLHIDVITTDFQQQE